MTSERSNLTTALYIGVPILVGASCYYYLYYNKNRNATGGTLKDGQIGLTNKQLSPKEQLAHLKLIGNQNFSRKNYDVAIDHYTKAIEFSKTLAQDGTLKPEDLAIFYQNRAACCEALGDFEKVVIDCDDAIKLKKNYTKAYVRRAKAHEKLGSYDRAMVDAFAANLLDKFQNQTYMLLTENIVKASSKLKAAEAMKTHIPSWPATQTIKVYFAAFSEDPIKERHPDLNNITPDQLQRLFDEAMKPENDNDPVSLSIRGSCYSLRSNLKAAQESFDKLLELDDKDCSSRIKSNALIKKAAIVISEPNTSSSIEKDLEQVHELLDKAVKIDPENPDIYLHKSQAFALVERYEECIEMLKKVIELKEDFHSAIAQKFYLEFKLAARDPSASYNLPKLLDVFKAKIKEHPESTDLLHMYAQVLTEMSLFEQADQVLLDLAKLDPNDGNVHVSRALLRFQLKNDPDAVAELMQEALRIDPKILFAYEIWASIESQRGRVDEAIKIFETSLKYIQSEAEYLKYYGLLDSTKSQKAAAELLGMQL